MTDNQVPGNYRDYLYFTEISTRWMDNDIYGHINNVTYYSFFDTAINGFLIEKNVLDIHSGDTIGLVVSTACNYYKPLSFPGAIRAGLNVRRIGRSSVTYNVGIFGPDDDTAAAEGHFVHVYVDRKTRKSSAIPDNLRAVLETVYIPADTDR